MTKRKHPDHNTQPSSRLTAQTLLDAVTSGDEERVNECLERLRNVNITNDDGKSILVIALENGHTEVVKALLEDSRIDVSQAQADKLNWLDLMTANNGRSKEAIKVLLANPKIDINQPISNDGTTILIEAAKRGLIDIIHTLLAVEGIEINITALSYAAYSGHTEIFKALLAANGGIKAEAASNLLVGVIQEGHTEIAKLLLAVNGIEVNQVDGDGKSVLMEAIEFGRTEIVKALLEFDGIEINKVDTNGCTALIYAAGSYLTQASLEGCQEMTKALLAVDGIEIHKANTWGETALIIAVNNSHTETARLIFDKLSDEQQWNIRDLLETDQQFWRVKPLLAEKVRQECFLPLLLATHANYGDFIP